MYVVFLVQKRTNAALIRQGLRPIPHASMSHRAVLTVGSSVFALTRPIGSQSLSFSYVQGTSSVYFYEWTHTHPLTCRALCAALLRRLRSPSSRTPRTSPSHHPPGRYNHHIPSRHLLVHLCLVPLPTLPTRHHCHRYILSQAMQMASKHASSMHRKETTRKTTSYMPTWRSIMVGV